MPLSLTPQVQCSSAVRSRARVYIRSLIQFYHLSSAGGTMKHVAFGFAALALVAGCHDTTSPPAGPTDISTEGSAIEAGAALTAPSLWPK